MLYLHGCRHLVNPDRKTVETELDSAVWELRKSAVRRQRVFVDTIDRLMMLGENWREGTGICSAGGYPSPRFRPRVTWDIAGGVRSESWYSEVAGIAWHTEGDWNRYCVVAADIVGSSATARRYPFGVHTSNAWDRLTGKDVVHCYWLYRATQELRQLPEGQKFFPLNPYGQPRIRFNDVAKIAAAGDYLMDSGHDIDFIGLVVKYGIREFPKNCWTG